MFRKLSLTLCALVALTAGRASASDQRTAFRYTANGSSGLFSVDPSVPGKWVEWTADGKSFAFRETARTADYIEIADAGRGVTIRLYAQAGTIAHRGTGGRFVLLYNGGWIGQGRPSGNDRVEITDDP